MPQIELPYEWTTAGMAFETAGCIRQQAADEALKAAQLAASPFAIYKPSLAPCGDAWSVLLGSNIMEGVAAFGPTPEAAVAAWNEAWRTQTTPEARRSAARSRGDAMSEPLRLTPAEREGVAGAVADHVIAAIEDGLAARQAAEIARLRAGLERLASAEALFTEATGSPSIWTASELGARRAFARALLDAAPAPVTDTERVTAELVMTSREVWRLLDEARSRDARWLGPKLREMHIRLGRAIVAVETAKETR